MTKLLISEEHEVFDALVQATNKTTRGMLKLLEIQEMVDLREPDSLSEILMNLVSKGIVITENGAWGVNFDSDNIPRTLVAPIYYSTADIFDWLKNEDSDLHYKWLRKVATDQKASKEEKCDTLIDIIEYASECLSEMAPSRSKQRKVAKEISILIDTIIE
jgi:hypothetical protein